MRGGEVRRGRALLAGKLWVREEVEDGGGWYTLVTGGRKITLERTELEQWVM